MGNVASVRSVVKKMGNVEGKMKNKEPTDLESEMFNGIILRASKQHNNEYIYTEEDIWGIVRAIIDKYQMENE